MVRAQSLQQPLGRRAALMALALGWVWMVAATAPYFQAGPLHPFIIEKLPASAASGWRWTLLAHVASALFALPACVLLTSETLRRRSLRVHRVLGRVTAAVVLLVVVPSGLYLSRTATGGALSTAGFAVSGGVMAGALVLAVDAARRHQVARHRRFMHHVLGQMAVAVLSRLMLVVAGALQLDPHVAYVVSLWAPVLGVVVGVELLHRPSTPTGAVIMPSLIRRLVVVLALPALLVTSPSEAAPLTGPGVLEQLQRGLVQPLAAQEAQHSRYSRASRPPADRRVRVEQEAPSLDGAGRAFYAFAVDERWSGDPRGAWSRDAIVGCIYPATGQVYVLRGGEWMAASWLFGEPADAPVGVCVGAGAI